MAEVNEYKRWLNSGISNREVVETFEITHSALDTIRIVNADRAIDATLEDGTTHTFNAGRFYWSPPEVTDTTNQSTTIAVSALDGRIYDIIRGLSFQERSEPIKATYRIFFFDDPSTPLISPPPTWYILSLEATREAVLVELQATQMRMQRIGLYYTAHEFPSIVFL